ncbi:hypothetical protein [Arthrobacter sp. TB 23]|uniref:hypothetical protein n=1 Tax=Arthrobacter sp. TB 23 TaxID=494419 RepID=UPI0002D362EA|nr:hypothetical protein [Arthrobacter sp. TB 23]
MTLLTAGVDVSVVVLRLGHADTHSTDAYLHADIAIKQAAADRTRPPEVAPWTCYPDQASWPGSPHFDYADIPTPKTTADPAPPAIIGIVQRSAWDI